MDHQKWIEDIDGMAGVYAFDILPDGSFSEIRLMAINGQNTGMLAANPDAPAFYPGIPWRRYFTDINFESYIYKCGSTRESLYSYVNAHGFWLKGFYHPLNTAEDAQVDVKTAYCLYIGTYSPQFDPDSMSQRSPEVSTAVTNISIRLHRTQDFCQAMAGAVAELKKVCGAEKCALYTVDKNDCKYSLIDESGYQDESRFAAEIGRTPFEVAQAWENDLADSDCLMIDDLSVIRERDPDWYKSLCNFQVKNLVLYAVRFNQTLVGFIWAADFDASKMITIKEILEMSSFLIGAVIANHQLVRRLEFMSTIDSLTRVSSRNAMNIRIEKFLSGEEKLPGKMGIAFADLNGLKYVNDFYGHGAGDKLLIRAAALLRLAFGDDEIYRIGGDEFVVLCPDITEQQLSERTEQLRALAENTPDVSFAVGTAWSGGEYDINEVMQTADENMYRDKEDYYRRNPDMRKRNRT